MLDIKFIRENPEIVKNAIRKKYIDFDLDAFLFLDEERKKLLQETEEARAKQNMLSDRVPRIADAAEKASAIEILKRLKERLSAYEDEFKVKDGEWQKQMFLIPNIPDPSVPEGISDGQNLEIRRWGAIRRFRFPIKDHISLMKDLNMVDLERGAKVSGFRGYFLKNDAVMITMALWKFVFNELMKKGFSSFIAPLMARQENFIGTGWLPQGEEEVYKTQDGLYLSGTAEVPMMGYHAGEILDEKELPKKYSAISWCLRREAGNYGKDTKGVFRIHEFIKIEQLILCKADHTESVYWHEELTKNSESIMQALNIPYRVVVNCGGDLGLGQVKKYDIEAWVPSEHRYRETHSASYFHDFQSRRLNIRYKDKEGKLRFVHSLNNTAVAIPRILIPLLENHQNEDGAILIPKVLQKFMEKKIIS